MTPTKPNVTSNFFVSRCSSTDLLFPLLGCVCLVDLALVVAPTLAISCVLHKVKGLGFRVLVDIHHKLCGYLGLKPWGERAGQPFSLHPLWWLDRKQGAPLKWQQWC